MPVPNHLRYTSEHEWLEIQGDVATVGITSYAADALGDIVYVDLPQPGSRVTGGEPCGELESTKSVSDLFAPADGEVLEVNEAAVEDPAVLNTDPFGKGWLFRLRVDGTDHLLDAVGYAALIEGD